MFEIDWGRLFAPTVPFVEIFLRGTVIYLVLFVVMRFLPRRTIGTMSASDILVIVLLSETVSNSLQGGNDGIEAITDGLLLAAVILAWATFVDWLDYKFPKLHITEAEPTLMVRNGELMRKNMARQHVTEDELLTQLREHGLDSPKKVVKAYLEGDGHMSVIVRGRGPVKPPSDQKPL